MREAVLLVSLWAAARPSRATMGTKACILFVVVLVIGVVWTYCGSGNDCE